MSGSALPGAWAAKNHHRFLGLAYASGLSIRMLVVALTAPLVAFAIAFAAGETTKTAPAGTVRSASPVSSSPATQSKVRISGIAATPGVPVLKAHLRRNPARRPTAGSIAAAKASVGATASAAPVPPARTPVPPARTPVTPAPDRPATNGAPSGSGNSGSGNSSSPTPSPPQAPTPGPSSAPAPAPTAGGPPPAPSGGSGVVSGGG
jgi:hypothetical protein